MPDQESNNNTGSLLAELSHITRDLRRFLIFQNQVGLDFAGSVKSDLWLPPKIVIRSERQRETPKKSSESKVLLNQLREKVGNCKKCRLAETRTKFVFGEGNPEARIVFVGEGPGRDEDLQGRPFVGAAGRLLENMIRAMGLERKDVYIGNIIKCRPPGNRNPSLDEIEACFPYLEEQLTILSPRVICALGKFAAQTLLDTQVPISRLRGKATRCYLGKGTERPREMLVVPTYHPAYLLRNSAQKRVVWEDLKVVMKVAREEIRGQGSEVRDQRSEVRDQGSGIRGQKSGMGMKREGRT